MPDCDRDHDNSLFNTTLLRSNNSTMVNRSGYAPKQKRQPPKTARREMTNVEKGMIIAFFYCLRNITHVAQTIGRPWTTIKSFLARVCEHQSLDNIPRPGRPSLLSQLQRRTIIREAKANRKMTRSDFRDHYAPGLSLSTGNKKKPGVLVLP